MQLYCKLPKEAGTSGLGKLRPQGFVEISPFALFPGKSEVSGECSPVQNISAGSSPTSGVNTIFALSKFLHTLKAMISPSFS